MNPERRAEIFSKDALTIDDLMELLELSYPMAAQVMRNIKRRHDRLQVKGRLHVQDYMEYFGMSSNRCAPKDPVIDQRGLPQ